MEILTIIIVAVVVGLIVGVVIAAGRKVIKERTAKEILEIVAKGLNDGAWHPASDIKKACVSGFINDELAIEMKEQPTPDSSHIVKMVIGEAKAEVRSILEGRDFKRRTNEIIKEHLLEQDFGGQMDRAVERRLDGLHTEDTKAREAALHLAEGLDLLFKHLNLEARNIPKHTELVKKTNKKK